MVVSDISFFVSQSLRWIVREARSEKRKQTWYFWVLLCPQAAKEFKQLFNFYFIELKALNQFYLHEKEDYVNITYNPIQCNPIQSNPIQRNPIQCNAMQYLRNRKHVPRFYRVIQTRVEVWKNEKCCGNTSHRRVFPQLFRVLPNFHECLYNSI